MPFGVNPKTGRPGPQPKKFVSGDKEQARHRVNREVAAGALPNPNSVPCADCGHIGNDKRHEYDHWNGYDADHFLDVQSVCTACHAKRDSSKKKQTHCIHGHEFSKENTLIKANGCRQCRECSRIRNRARRDAAFWREYRRKRKERSDG